MAALSPAGAVARRAVSPAAAGARGPGRGRALPRATAQDPRYTLWAAWHRSGLQRRWLAAIERGGPAGAQAGRDLEAVTALFDITDHYVSRTPGASLRGLIEHVAALQLPGVNPDPASTAEQVRVLSAHAALGHEWDLVVIAGLQDGLWPNTIPRGGVLATQRLLDVLDGVGEDASVRAPLLAEERRLLIAAMGRARRRLLVTAIDSDTGGPDRSAALPSPFFWRDRAVGRRRHRSRSAAAGFSTASAVGGGAGRPVARCRVRSRRCRGRRRSPLCGNTIGAVGRCRCAGCRPGRLARPDPGQHRRSALRRRAIPSR